MIAHLVSVSPTNYRTPVSFVQTTSTKRVQKIFFWKITYFCVVKTGKTKNMLKLFSNSIWTIGTRVQTVGVSLKIFHKFRYFSIKWMYQIIDYHINLQKNIVFFPKFKTKIIIWNIYIFSRKCIKIHRVIDTYIYICRVIVSITGYISLLSEEPWEVDFKVLLFFPF